MKYLAALLIALTLSAHAQALDIISWNVESGGADPEIIAQQLAELPRADAYLLQEVDARDIGRYAFAVREKHGKGYKYFVTSLGGRDRLAIIVDGTKFHIRSFSELMSYKKYRLNDFGHRSPLVTHLERKSDGQELLLVTVHLARGNEDLRKEQATGLSEWAKAQSFPVILAGDCNFDLDIINKRGNASYDAFLATKVWQMAALDEEIDTNWDDRDGDGVDNYPNSRLDFAAVKANGKPLTTKSYVIVRPGDFPDTEATSDHRPLFLNVSP
ncbi:endonuclease/exonuclease/phosphatase family protein [Adhaeretor mobilis]|uniref:Endonuclease/Exonuclease/phosphatase family protein n=1 Tax=Adhaeretor mobilis TaxID=1930276 RepID=A0A517MSA3_9BACT|nr:endonuclease/exonuclease/phosphatase family protein [Adhaeretor mobilis]QDS97760.1 Endonuclease/Exonuclease/phosphatase family protein [Adhaeretor mobilis]